MGIGNGSLFGVLGSMFLRQVWMQMSEANNTTQAVHRVSERGITQAEMTAFKACLAVKSDKPGEGCNAKIYDGELHIRPRSIPNFRKVMADRGLGEHVILMGVMKWLEGDCNRWLRFGYEWR